jgi:hypothetical protein
MGRALGLYGLACMVAIGFAASVLCLVYSGSSEQRAVVVSALVALVVQMIAFAIARLLAGTGSAIAGWGLGALICFAALVVYGFVSRALGLPSNAALVSLATFFFLTELIEPPLLTV